MDVKLLKTFKLNVKLVPIVEGALKQLKKYWLLKMKISYLILLLLLCVACVSAKKPETPDDKCFIKNNKEKIPCGEIIHAPPPAYGNKVCAINNIKHYNI